MNDKKILLAEDDNGDAELILAALDEFDLAVETAVVRDGQQALEYLESRESRSERPALLPRVILADLKMPRMNGIELIRHLRGEARWRLLPVVVLTSSAEPTDIGAAYRSGANAYVVKPVEFDEFLETIRRVARFWVGTNYTPPMAGEAGLTSMAPSALAAR